MPLILGTNSIKDTGYEVANSCRFNDDSDDHLDRTPSSSGNRRTWTWSCWFKRASFTSNSRVFVAHSDNSNRVEIGIHNETVNCFRVELLSSSSNSELQTNAVFRDPSAWFHAVVAVDTTQGTDSNRVKLYINGTQVTSFQTESYPTQNTEYVINHTVEHNIGKSINFSRPYDGYMCEVVLIDGTQLDASSFGEFDDSGIWKPIDVSGLTFGTNGFYLDFENSGSLGADVSGNGNNFTLLGNNLQGSQLTFSEGNCKVQDSGGSNDPYIPSTIGVTKGKWYAELKLDAYTEDGHAFGIAATDSDFSESTANLFCMLQYATKGADNLPRIYNFGDLSDNNLTDNNAGDIIGCAVDVDNGTVDFTVNGSAYGSQVTGLSSNFSGKTIFFIIRGEGGASRTFTSSVNFGNPPFSISSGNSDAEGFGNFEYSVPSGYFSLCTKNLAEYG